MDRRRRAVHEAGHALVAYLEGIEVQGATIRIADIPEEQGEGGVWTGEPDAWTDKRLRSTARVLWAGTVAEEVLLSERMSTYGGDLKALQDLGMEHGEGAAHLVKEAFRSEAREMLAAHRLVLEELSDLLEKEGTVDGEVLSDFLDEHLN